MGSVLDTPFFSCLRGDGLHHVTLPGLLAAAVADDVQDMPAVRPHQRQALHSFLAQVGALALFTAGREAVPSSETEWEALLRGLTPDYPDDSPWTLVVADLTKPALLQPPLPEGTLDALREQEETPDAIDMLVTAKDHDVKSARMARATPEQWFLALLTRQTMDGFLGAGNYGVSRMNGGFASRPMVGLAPAGGWGARLQRDIRRLLDLRRGPLPAAWGGYKVAGGIGLVWLVPWDGVTAIRVSDLDPLYIEICRRIRLVEDGTRIVARRGGSRAARIAFPKEAKGVTGDPWAPVDLREVKCLTVDGSGFSYRRVLDLIGASTNTRTFDPAPLQVWRQDDGDRGIELVLTATVRGQGGTDGFHERRIAFPPGAPRLLAMDPDPFATLARQHQQDAATMQRNVLKPALYALFQNGPEQVDHRHVPSERKAEPFLASFDRAVDGVFFDHLFGEFTASTTDAKAQARRVWLLDLQRLAREHIEAAEATTARPGLRRYGAAAAALNAFDGACRFRFPELSGAPSE